MRLYLQLPTGTKECVVEVLNASDTPSTHSNHTKVKLTSLLVSGELGTLSIGNAWLELGIV